MLSALKNFGVTFLISALVFGVIAYFATLFVSRTVNNILDDESKDLNEIISSEGPAPEETKQQEEQDDPERSDLPEGESFNLLLVTTDYRPDLYNDYRPSAETIEEKTAGLEDAIPTIGLLSADFRSVNATAIVLVRADREKAQYLFTYFTPEMEVYTPGGNRTLSEVYTLYGISTLSEYVNAMTGLKIHYTAVVEGYHFDDLAALLGPVTVTLPRDIYSDGTEYNMNYETLVERTGTDGYPWTEHVQNQWIMGAGENVLDGDKLYTLSITAEHTEADRDAKMSYTLDIVRAYIEKLTEPGADASRTLFEQLVTERSGWIRIEGYTPTAEELEAAEGGETQSAPEGEEEAGQTEEITPDVPDDLPFDPTPMDTTAPVQEGSEEAENPETEEEEKPLWVLPIGEPQTCILSIDCTVEQFENSFGMLSAVTLFDSTTLSYPCNYTPASADRSEFFTVRLKDGLDLFLPYRTGSNR